MRRTNGGRAGKGSFGLVQSMCRSGGKVDILLRISCEQFLVVSVAQDEVDKLELHAGSPVRAVVGASGTRLAPA